jgi:hypothetical protein
MVLDNSGNLTLSGDIRSVNTATQQNLFATNVSAVLLGGSGGVLIGKTTTYPNTYLEVTPFGYNTFLDLHCSTVSNDFDARIVATAGGVGDGKAILGFISGTFDVSASTKLTITTPRIDMETSNYINTSSPTLSLKQSTLNINSTTANIVSSTLNMSAPTIKINTNLFRFVPWTTSYSGSSVSTIISVPSGGTQPTANSSARIKYRYSIIGNSMYVNFYFYQANPGSGGNGAYQYAIPAAGTYAIDPTDIQPSTNGGSNNTGTKVGNIDFKHYGASNALGAVYVLGSGVGARLIMWAEVGNIFQQQSNAYYSLSSPNPLAIAFEAVLPILVP